MDIALSTILLIFLLLPGLSFRRLYYTEEFSKEYFKESIPSFFISTIVPGTLIHFLGWQFVTLWYDLDVKTISILFSGTDSTDDLAIAFTTLHRRLSAIFLYFTFLSLLGALLGAVCKLVVRKRKLDRKFKLFRFQNEWHYLFSGEILDFPRILGAAENYDFTYVDVLMETSKGPVIYMGILSDYLLSKSGGIDRIYLSTVRRRFLADDNQNQYYDLPGKFFVIPFDKVVNLHLTYYSLN